MVPIPCLDHETLLRDQGGERSLILMEDSKEKFSKGEKLGFDARNAMVTNEEGAEIDSIEVIRDNDKLFLVEDPNSLM
ncbi:hypothetical protein AAG906_017709 [Vitis piasezkii]